MFLARSHVVKRQIVVSDIYFIDILLDSRINIDERMATMLDGHRYGKLLHSGGRDRPARSCLEHDENVLSVRRTGLPIETTRDFPYRYCRSIGNAFQSASLSQLFLDPPVPTPSKSPH